MINTVYLNMLYLVQCTVSLCLKKKQIINLFIKIKKFFFKENTLDQEYSFIMDKLSYEVDFHWTGEFSQQEKDDYL